MRSIRYAAPTSVDEAARILAEHGESARVFVGGTDLIVQVREGLRDCDLFVDAKRMPAVTEIRAASDGSLTLGAAVPCALIYGNTYIRRVFSALVDSTSIIGGIGIQSRVSVGGDLGDSGPAGDSIQSATHSQRTVRPSAAIRAARAQESRGAEWSRPRGCTALDPPRQAR